VKRMEGVLQAADRFQQRHGVLGFPVAVIKKFGDDEAGKHAALLAYYYGFLSLFPLLLVSSPHSATRWPTTRRCSSRSSTPS
jgi:membrane protein